MLFKADVTMLDPQPQITQHSNLWSYFVVIVREMAQFDYTGYADKSDSKL